MKRLIAIGVIWLGCAIAWLILGSALVVRSGEASGARMDEVQGLWGPAMRQLPPRILSPTSASPTGEEKGRESQQGTPQAQGPQLVPAAKGSLDGSDIAVRLALTHRQKGLLWFSTYDVEYASTYAFTNNAEDEAVYTLEFPLLPGEVVYDGFVIADSNGQPVDVSIRDGSARWEAKFDAGERRVYSIKYKSRGTSQWHYALTDGTGKVKNFRLALATDFEEIDFIAGSLSPSKKWTEGGHFRGEWVFDSLIASSSIGIELPQKVNPGPLASRITFFAPVGLLFFFFVVAIFAAAQKKEIHPLNYLFFGCAFFAYHLLFSYLVDHLAIGPSLAIASVVSVLLVVTYARLFVGWRFALVEMGIAQALYLVLFSVTFLWQGFTGLSITVGAILSLFVMMQVTGRARWNEALSPAGAAPKNTTKSFVDVPAGPDHEG